VVGNDGQFGKLCEALGHVEWATDERFVNNAQRICHLPALMELLRAEFSRFKRRELISALDNAGVPCGPINSVADVFEEPQVQAREMLRHVPHPSGVDVPQVASPMRFADAAMPMREATPLLGQHSEAILGELCYTAEQIQSMRAAGVI
jgi:crotonobetainyl-CoA:carnitine CoA-transferase CaiB-like acyl-CoA transferase